MIWTDAADALLLRLWTDGGTLSDIAAGMGEAGYSVTRGMVAGRKHRLRKTREIAARPAIARTTPKPRSPTMKPVLKPASRTPVTISEVEALASNEGVEYLENEGCKALLSKRSGKWQLQMCCGEPFGLDYNGAQSSYCPTHFRLFTNPSAALRSANG